jgi:hypothetical protein
MPLFCTRKNVPKKLDAAINPMGSFSASLKPDRLISRAEERALYKIPTNHGGSGTHA